MITARAFEFGWFKKINFVATSTCFQVKTSYFKLLIILVVWLFFLFNVLPFWLLSGYLAFIAGVK